MTSISATDRNYCFRTIYCCIFNIVRSQIGDKKCIDMAVAWPRMIRENEREVNRERERSRLSASAVLCWTISHNYYYCLLPLLLHVNYNGGTSNFSRRNWLKALFARTSGSERTNGTGADQQCAVCLCFRHSQHTTPYEPRYLCILLIVCACLHIAVYAENYWSCIFEQPADCNIIQLVNDQLKQDWSRMCRCCVLHTLTHTNISLLMRYRIKSIRNKKYCAMVIEDKCQPRWEKSVIWRNNPCPLTTIFPMYRLQYTRVTFFVCPPSRAPNNGHQFENDHTIEHSVCVLRCIESIFDLNFQMKSGPRQKKTHGNFTIEMKTHAHTHTPGRKKCLAWQHDGIMFSVTLHHTVINRGQISEKLKNVDEREREGER